jgi:hypothetical protein
MEALVWYVIGVLGFAVHAAWRGRSWSGQERLEAAVRWWFLSGGLWLLFSASGHLFVPDQVAESIGWPAGSPFQREVGFSDLAWGVLGIACVRVRGSFREAFAVGTLLFLWGAAGGHIYELVTEDNRARNNAGILLYVDILAPAINVLLLWRLRLAERETPESPSPRLEAAASA